MKTYSPHEKKCDGSMPTPLAHMPTAITRLTAAVLKLADAINPILGELLRPVATTTDLIVGVAAVAAFMKGPVGVQVEEENQVSIDISAAYFVLEGFSDELGKVDEDGTAFLYTREVAIFNKGMLECFEEKDRTKRSGNLHLIAREIGQRDIATEYREPLRRMIASLPPNRATELPPWFVANPEIWMLELNAVSVMGFHDHLIAISVLIPEAKLLVEKALDGLRGRYIGMQDVIHDISAPIEVSVDIGKRTILTDCFAGQFACVARAAAKCNETELVRQIVESQREIIEATDLHSAIIRLLNDAGTLLLFEKEKLEGVLDQVRTRYGMSGDTPRRAFARMHLRCIVLAKKGAMRNGADGEGTKEVDPRKAEDVTHDDAVAEPESLRSLCNICSRFIKDSTKAEYNTNLNSSIFPHTSPDDQWRILRDNILYSSARYRQSMNQFIPLLGKLKSECPFAYNWFGRFVLFNHEVYGRHGGDYLAPIDCASFESMREADICFEERLTRFG